MQAELTRLLRASPFIPFVVRLRDGRSFPIEAVGRMSVGKHACAIVNPEGVLLHVPFHAIDHAVVREAPAEG